MLPHDLILDGLRPKLRSAEPARTLTPTRIFCRPFEDLLASRPRNGKQKGRIARDSIQPVWSWLETTLAPEAMAAYVAGVKDAVLGYHREVAMSCAAELWPARRRGHPRRPCRRGRGQGRAPCAGQRGGGRRMRARWR